MTLHDQWRSADHQFRAFVAFFFLQCLQKANYFRSKSSTGNDVTTTNGNGEQSNGIKTGSAKLSSDEELICKWKIFVDKTYTVCPRDCGLLLGKFCSFWAQAIFCHFPNNPRMLFSSKVVNIDPKKVTYFEGSQSLANTVLQGFWTMYSYWTPTDLFQYVEVPMLNPKSHVITGRILSCLLSYEEPYGVNILGPVGQMGKMTQMTWTNLFFFQRLTSFSIHQSTKEENHLEISHIQNMSDFYCWQVW